MPTAVTPAVITRTSRRRMIILALTNGAVQVTTLPSEALRPTPNEILLVTAILQFKIFLAVLGPILKHVVPVISSSLSLMAGCLLTIAAAVLVVPHGGFAELMSSALNSRYTES